MMSMISREKRGIRTEDLGRYCLIMLTEAVLCTHVLITSDFSYFQNLRLKDFLILEEIVNRMVSFKTRKENMFALVIKTRSHCVICDCDLVLLTMGCKGVNDLVAIA